LVNELFEVVDSNVEECIVSDQPISTMMLMKDSEMSNLLGIQAAISSLSMIFGMEQVEVELLH
jgi:hypothetical protein